MSYNGWDKGRQRRGEDKKQNKRDHCSEWSVKRGRIVAVARNRVSEYDGENVVQGRVHNA